MAEEMKNCKCGSLSFRLKNIDGVSVIVCTVCGSKYESQEDLGTYNRHENGWTSFDLKEVEKHIPEDMIYCGKIGKIHILRGDEGYWVGTDKELSEFKETRTKRHIHMSYFASVILGIKGE